MSDSGAGERARQRGAAERAEVEEKEREDAEQGRLRSLYYERRLRLSCSRSRWLLDPESSASTNLLVAIVLPVLFIVAYGLDVLLNTKIYPEVRAAAPLVLTLLGAVAVALTALRQTLVVLAARAWEAEQRWIASLPFPLEKHLEVLGDFSRSGKLSLHVSFASGSIAIVEKARERLAGVDPGGSVMAIDQGLELVARPGGRRDKERVEATRDARLLLHDLVDAVLLPLHAQEPISRVVLGYT